MSKSFDTINIHTLIKKLLQTNIPGKIIKNTANYIKVFKSYTTYRNHTSRQRQFKTGVLQCGILSPTLFNICTSDLPPPNAPVQVMTSPSHLHTQARVQQRNTYNHTYINFLGGKTKQSHTKSRQNNLHSVQSRVYIINIWT